MNTILSDYRLIWNFAVRYRKSTTFAGPAGAFGAILFALLLLLYAWVTGKTLAEKTGNFALPVAFTAAFFMVGIGVFYWIRLLKGAMMLNSPTCAKLVPRIRTRIIQFIWLTWLALTFSAALVSEIHSPSSFWSTFTTFGGLLLGAALFLSTIVHSLQAMFIGWLMATLWQKVKIYLPSAQCSIFTSNAAVPVYLLLTLLLSYYCVVWMFPRGGDRHMWQQYWVAHMFEKWNASKHDAPRTTDSRIFDALFGLLLLPQKIVFITIFKLFDPLRNAAIRLDRTRPTSRNALLLYLTDTNAKWQNLVTKLTLVPITLISCALLSLLWGGNPVQQIAMTVKFVTKTTADGWPLFTSLILIPVWRMKRYVARILQTRPEQALIRLSPLVGSLGKFNRHLASQLIRHNFSVWLVWTSAAMLLAALSGMSATSLMAQFALCCAGLPFIAAPLLDYSANATRQFNNALWGTAGVTGLLLLVAVLSFLIAGSNVFGAQRQAWQASHILQWSIGFALSNAALAVILLAARWRMMMVAPVAFPAMRRQQP